MKSFLGDGESSFLTESRTLITVARLQKGGSERISQERLLMGTKGLFRPQLHLNCRNELHRTFNKEIFNL